MSKARVIIALFVMLSMLAGVYTFIVLRETNEIATVAQERISILDFEVENISKMVLKSDNKALTIIRDEDTWIVDYPYPIVLDMRNIEDIAFSFARLTAEELVDENPDDLAPFGLDNPSVEASVFLTDGTKHTILLGNRTPVGNMFYVMNEGDPRVFAVWGSHGNHFSYTLNDLRETQLTEINLQELTYFKLVRETDRPIEIVVTEQADEIQLQLGFARWHMIQPYNEYASVHFERFNTLLSALPELEISKFIDDSPINLADYGLDTPTMELKVKDNQNTLHLLFGDDMDEQHIYFQISGERAVYAMEIEALDSFKATTPFELIDRFSFIVLIDHVDKILIDTRETDYIITLERITKEAANQDEEDEVVTTFAINGKEIGDEEFRDFYQVLIGLIVEAETNEVPDEQPYVVTEFHFNKEDMPDVSIAYVPFNDDFFAVVRGGVAEFLISRKQVYHMLSELQRMTE